MSVKPCLAPTAVQAAITIANTQTTLPAIGLQGYSGAPLYLHALSDGSTLSILIDGVSSGGPNDEVEGLLPASSIEVTFNVGKTQHAWPAFTAEFGSKLLDFSANLDSALNLLTLVITDSQSATGSTEYGVVRFVLLQTAPDGPYYFNWIKLDEVEIDGISALTNGDVVDICPPGNRGGSIAGPMGFILS